MAVYDIKNIFATIGLGIWFAGCGDLGTFTSDADICDGYQNPLSSPYVSPLAPGKDVSVSQANCGTYTHFGNIKYAYDIVVDIGTPIYAIRSGTVYARMDNYENFGGHGNGANHVDIQHEDGTLAYYTHLNKKGVLVEKGDSVVQGQLIAFSGASGTSGPHLHLHVYTDTHYSRTIPITFKNVEDNANGLQHNTTHKTKTFANLESVTLYPAATTNPVYENSASNCFANGASLPALPSIATMTEISATKYEKLKKDDGQTTFVECNYGSATANVQAMLFAFDVDRYNKDGYKSFSISWKASSGIYSTTCTGTTSTFTAGGSALTPYNRLQVFKGNTSTWKDVGTTSQTVAFSNGESPYVSEYVYAGKIWFRMVAGDGGGAGTCSSLILDQIKLTLNKPD